MKMSGLQEKDKEDIGCSAISNQDEDVIVSMVEVLEEEKQLFDDANAVLGGSDAQYCTYLQGYVDRQALYMCRTCATSEPAGVCLACSLECHDGHDLIELYTKRKFRCDCGNAKFDKLACNLCPKVARNNDNRYNQNFNGVYCTCARPYPDPDDTVEDTMIQCVVCEDWFHGRHLNSESPVDDESFDEMICNACMQQHPFLTHYQELSNVHVDCDGDEAVDVETNEICSPKDLAVQGDEAVDIENDADAVQVKCRLSVCEPSTSHKSQPFNSVTGPAFFQSSWRQMLCKCPKCLLMYECEGVGYLLELSDSILVYEARGKAKAGAEPYQQGLDALSQLNHVQQVEMLEGYNDLKSKLTAYLKKFADNKKVVREEDVTEFFTQMAARKRQKTSTSQQYLCK